MKGGWLWLFVGIWVLLCGPCWGAPTLPSAVLEDLQSLSSEVIVRRGPCSATCGLGLRAEELCMLGEDGAVRDCTERQVQCLLTWQCGLRTFTMAAGGQAELDCLGEVMEARGRFGYFLSWRYAHGVVTTDDSLFGRWDAPGWTESHYTPLREDHAGTYRCDVQDSGHRMVKRVYFGLKVVPPEVLHLNFASALAQWDVLEQEGQQGRNDTSDPRLEPLYPPAILRAMLLYSLAVSVTVAGLIFLSLHCVSIRRYPHLPLPPLCLQPPLPS